MIVDLMALIAKLTYTSVQISTKKRGDDCYCHF